LSGTLKKDDNDYPVSGGVSSSNANQVLPFEVNPLTGALLVQNATGGGGTGTWWAVTGAINSVNVTFTIATAVKSDFVLLLNRQPQQQDIGASTWDYSYSAGASTTTITYHSAPDISLAGTPHAAFVIS
jgi:hypothetical protein